MAMESSSLLSHARAARADVQAASAVSNAVAASVVARTVVIVDVDSRTETGGLQDLPFRFRLEYPMVRRNAVVVSLITYVSLCGPFFFKPILAQVQQPPSPLSRQEPYDRAPAREQTVPRAQNGYLVSFTPVITHSSLNAIVLRSIATMEELDLPFWIQGAGEVHIEDIALNSRAQIYVVGSFVRPGDIALTNFSAELDNAGRLMALYQLGPYRPKRVCAANDGSFWLFGQVLSDAHEGLYSHLLRYYAPDGQLVNAYLTRDMFPALSETSFGRRQVFLTCDSDHAGIYFTLSRRWVQVSERTSVVQQWRVEPVTSLKITGIAVLPDHHIYASFSTSPSQTVAGGFYVLDLVSADSARWTLITASPHPVLLGDEGDYLIYTQPSSPTASRALYWLRP
jgi:hypothetical protein